MFSLELLVPPIYTPFMESKPFLFIVPSKQVSNSGGSRKLHIMHLGMKADLVALSKVGAFKRSFTRGPKQSRGGKNSKGSPGICYLCLAGRETHNPVIHFEDFSRKALWHDTHLTELPYDRIPAVLNDLPWGPPEQGPDFFKHDFWHNWHNGVAKVYIASAFVVINMARVVPGNSIDARFEALNKDYHCFCKMNKISAYLKDINRDTFGMDTAQVFPNGSWNKAAVSTQLMLFLGDFCQRHIRGKSDDVLLLTIAPRLCLASHLFRIIFFVYRVSQLATCAISCLSRRKPLIS